MTSRRFAVARLILVALIGLSITACGMVRAKPEDELSKLKARQAVLEAQLAKTTGESAADVAPAPTPTRVEAAAKAPVEAAAESTETLDPVIAQGMSPAELARLEWYKRCMQDLMRTAAESGRAVLPAHTAQACGYGGVFAGYKHDWNQSDARLAVSLRREQAESTPTIPTLDDGGTGSVLKVNLPSLQLVGE